MLWEFEREFWAFEVEREDDMKQSEAKAEETMAVHMHRLRLNRGRLKGTPMERGLLKIHTKRVKGLARTEFSENLGL